MLLAGEGIVAGSLLLAGLGLAASASGTGYGTAGPLTLASDYSTAYSTGPMAGLCSCPFRFCIWLWIFLCSCLC